MLFFIIAAVGFFLLRAVVFLFAVVFFLLAVVFLFAAFLFFFAMVFLPVVLVDSSSYSLINFKLTIHELNF